MKSNWLAFSLAMLAVTGLYPGLGACSSLSQLMGEESWAVYDDEIESFQLAEDAAGPSAPGDDAPGLAITDSSGRQSRDSLEMPSGSLVRIRLTPAASGDLELFCLYPTGSVAGILNGSVEKDRSYTTWMQAELQGDYELWFVVNGARSNSVKIRVLEAEAMQDSMAGPTGMLSGVRAPALSYSMSPAAAAGAGPSIGLSAGGAKDVSSFRENINQSYLPLPSDVTYEGFFYDYYFETGAAQECNKLFCPSYSYAVSKDPFSGEPEYYLSLGLNSGIRDFQRTKLNLVVVLDYSGSMGSGFDQYYYDRFGNMVEVDQRGPESSKTKMQIADESVAGLLDHLNPEDRFGMVIFSDEAFLLDPLTGMADKNPDKLRSSILAIKETYGTNMEAGMEKGTALFDRLLPQDADYENRIIFLTDAMPNLGETGDLPLYRMLEDNADRGIYTTFIGIGVDFNTELIENITKIKGANYYSIHSADEFKQRLEDEFDFMVTPLVFDLRLRLDAPGYEIQKVYGSPEADLATGDLMKVNTLFPSRAEEGAVRGGVILVKLRQLSDTGRIVLSAGYEDRDGRLDSDEAVVELEESTSDFYQNNGVRKAVLLARYADLLKNWMIDERRAAEKGWRIVPSVTLASGIVIPLELGEWERQSLPLTVSDPYPEFFGRFREYFQVEAQAIGDSSLDREDAILRKLEGYGRPIADAEQI
ncbi:MAG: VWA domain-containing protein [Methanothrix sp.]